jgi:hypothetical protein
MDAREHRPITEEISFRRFKYAFSELISNFMEAIKNIFLMFYTFKKYPYRGIVPLKYIEARDVLERM